MPSIAMIGSGLLVLVAGGWAFLNPQRFYEIRQRGHPHLLHNSAVLGS